ncbi:hypothetical protein Sste5346_000276 [Sporothrix stenoceras]|uniref:Uncharacterized protein n=1 Tax=Sporothrix stenoceras TaxID=5173 RepID=A0ABR3ZUI4_9PEZI
MASNYRHTWDADSNKDLLIAMAETLSPNGEKIRAIVERTTAMGYAFTPKAVSQHLQKLRRTTGDSSSSGPSTPKTPKTPKIPKTPKTPKAKATPKTGGKRKAAVKSEDDDSLKEDSPSSPKKVKTEGSIAEDGDDLAVKSEYVFFSSAG